MVSSFRSGKFVITRNALHELREETDDVARGLGRHLRCDWGELDDEDWETNNHAVHRGLRLLSAYRTRSGQRFWVITEADRSITTVLLPEDY